MLEYNRKVMMTKYICPENAYSSVYFFSGEMIAQMIKELAFVIQMTTIFCSLLVIISS